MGSGTSIQLDQVLRLLRCLMTYKMAELCLINTCTRRLSSTCTSQEMLRSFSKIWSKQNRWASHTLNPISHLLLRIELTAGKRAENQRPREEEPAASNRPKSSPTKWASTSSLRPSWTSSYVSTRSSSQSSWICSKELTLMATASLAAKNSYLCTKQWTSILCRMSINSTERSIAFWTF